MLSSPVSLRAPPNSLASVQHEEPVEPPLLSLSESRMTAVCAFFIAHALDMRIPVVVSIPTMRMHGGPLTTSEVAHYLSMFRRWMVVNPNMTLTSRPLLERQEMWLYPCQFMRVHLLVDNGMVFAGTEVTGFTQAVSIDVVETHSSSLTRHAAYRQVEHMVQNAKMRMATQV
jgi:hypothetical protein